VIGRTYTPDRDYSSDRGTLDFEGKLRTYGRANEINTYNRANVRPFRSVEAINSNLHTGARPRRTLWSFEPAQEEAGQEEAGQEEQ